MPVTLQSERFILRPFVQSDIGIVFSGLSDPEVTKYYGVKYDTLEACQAQMEFFEQLPNTDSGMWFAICRKSDGVMVGAGGLNGLSRAHQKAEVGFWLLKPYWRQGILHETMPLIIHYGFTELKLHRIEGIVESENELCKKSIEKAGFIYEGRMHDAEIKDGKFISLDIYALINKFG